MVGTIQDSILLQICLNNLCQRMNFCQHALTKMESVNACWHLAIFLHIVYLFSDCIE